MKKILITGFSGFVGFHFCEYLENNGIQCRIKGIDIQKPFVKRDHFKNLQIDFEKINLLNKNKVKSAVEQFQPDYILHLASYSSVAFSWQQPVESFQNNTNIFLNLLEAVHKLNLSSRILSVGSSEEYGDVHEEDLPLTETHPLNPISPYAVARVSQELLSGIYADNYELDIVMTRSFNHIGPDQKDIFALPSFVKQLVHVKTGQERIKELVTGDISIVRDFTDVRDVVAAYYLLLTGGDKGEVYNVCSGKGRPLKELIDMAGDMLGIKVKTRTDPSLIRLNDNKMMIGSNQKITDRLHWQMKYTLEESIRDMIEYWKKQFS